MAALRAAEEGTFFQNPQGGYFQNFSGQGVYHPLPPIPDPCYNQATGIGGRGYFWYTPPLAENFSKIPPWRFWVKPPFCFLYERKTLIFTLI